MKNKVYYEKTAKLVNTKTGVEISAETDNMRPGESFTAWLANTKFKMRWNGKVYVGNVAGLELTSDGPAELNVRRR